MAEVMQTSAEALRRWEVRLAQRTGPPRKRGRPDTVPPEARWKLRRCYQEHYKQWGPSVLAAWARRVSLGTWSPSTIARVIEDLREEKPKQAPPRRYEIAAPGVLWAEDGAAFRDRGRKRELVVVQDECSRFKPAHTLAEGPAKGTDVLAVLEAAFAENEPPLVLKRDGGSIFDEQSVMRLLDRHDVVVITSPPHYPRYNGKKERSFRDVRGFERALRRRHRGLSLGARIDAAIHDLNEERPRPVLGGRTAREVFEQERRALPRRRRFRKEVEQREQQLVAEAASRHQRDAARRRAVEDVLSRYGLLQWTGDVSTNSLAVGGTN
jgi:transposase InsO family protein